MPAARARVISFFMIKTFLPERNFLALMWGVPPQGSLTSQIPTKLYTSHKSTNFVTPPYARPYLSSRAKGQFFVPQWPDRPGSGQAHACLMHSSGERQNCGGKVLPLGDRAGARRAEVRHTKKTPSR